MCNVAGRDVTSVVQDIATQVNPILAAQPGYRVAYGGQFESAEEAGRLLAVLGLAVIVGHRVSLVAGLWVASAMRR